jgi:hypothetical protein
VPDDLFIGRAATISQCGTYRYTLSRHFEGGEGSCVFVMLNPSTADSAVDDPTLRRCMGFAIGWGFRRLVVVNLYAFRATKPADLWRAEDPVGPENDNWIRHELADSQTRRVVLAWGAHGKKNGRGQRVEDLIRVERRSGTYAGTLGRTKAGEPKHPLYLRADTEFQS